MSEKVIYTNFTKSNFFIVGKIVELTKIVFEGNHPFSGSLNENNELVCPFTYDIKEQFKRCPSWSIKHVK